MNHDRHKDSFGWTVTKGNAQPNSQKNGKSKDPKDDFRLSSKFAEPTKNHFRQRMTLTHRSRRASKIARWKVAIDPRFSNLNPQFLPSLRLRASAREMSSLVGVLLRSP